MAVLLVQLMWKYSIYVNFCQYQQLEYGDLIWARTLGLTAGHNRLEDTLNGTWTNLNSTYLSVDDWGTHIAKQEFTWICTKPGLSFTFLQRMFSGSVQFSQFFENSHNPATTWRQGRRMNTGKEQNLLQRVPATGSGRPVQMSALLGTATLHREPSTSHSVYSKW